MIVRRTAPWMTLWTLAALVGSQAQALAQGAAPDAFCEGCCEHDMQLFAPVDFDMECLPIREDCGYFFHYSRLLWNTSGDRAIIGAPGLTDQSELIFGSNKAGFDDLIDLTPNDGINNPVVPPPYTIINGIQDAPPHSEWGWGHRYEIGKFSGGNGWMVGVLSGPETTSQRLYGFQELTIPGTLPLATQLEDPNFGGVVAGAGPDGVLPVRGSSLSTTTNGFGSVHVNFEIPLGLLHGFRDYHVNGPNNEQAPTTGGPGFQFTTIAIGAINGIPVVTDFTLARGADGITDNLDGDNLAGFFVVFNDTNGNGVQDDDEPIIGTGVDFDDLHKFNVRFNTLLVRNTSRTDGVELMRYHELDNSHMPVKEQRNRFEIGYGARYFRFADDFSWDGDIDIMGRTYQTTEADSNIVGPQIRARWTHQQSRLNFNLDGRFMFGYNVQNLSQNGGIGQMLQPGGLNSPIYLQPTSFAYGRRDDFFSPLAELRAEARYQFTGAIAARLGYTAIFVDNITRASQVVRYALPDMGILEGGNQELFINGVDLGVEAVY